MLLKHRGAAYNAGTQGSEFIVSILAQDLKNLWREKLLYLLSAGTFRRDWSTMKITRLLIRSSFDNRETIANWNLFVCSVTTSVLWLVTITLLCFFDLFLSLRVEQKLIFHTIFRFCRRKMLLFMRIIDANWNEMTWSRLNLEEQ